MSREQVGIEGVRLARIIDGDFERVIVEVEVDGVWSEVIRELHDNWFDHAVYASGIKACLVRPKGVRG